MKKIYLSLILVLVNLSISNAQVLDPVKWDFQVRKITEDTYELIFNASIQKGWHMYGLNIDAGGPVPTSINYNDSSIIKFLSDIQLSRPAEVKYDPTFEMDVELFDSKISFSQKIELLKKGNDTIHGYVEFMACDDSRCLPPKEVEFSFILHIGKVTSPDLGKISQPAKAKIREGSEVTDGFAKDTHNLEISMDPNISSGDTLTTDGEKLNMNADKDDGQKSLMTLFFIAFLAGFGALLTPCVYPIIPLTVSFFMRDTSKSKAILNGIFFGISIVLIYTLVGLIAGLFKIDLVRLVSSHWLPNILFFIIFLLLAFSFFGMFEITLPSSLSTKIDKQADKGGVLGPFFMALATVIISFSCTGPIVGWVLGTALQGEIIRPVVGMLGFSISFALPFTLLAIFPGFMKKLPKSGGWLNSVKVFFAFLLLAFSLIFITNLGLNFVSRELIISILIVLFFLLGLYLLGKIKFSHDSELEYISVPRLLIAIASFSFMVYLIPGLFGAPLKPISPFLPAKSESGIDLSGTRLSDHSAKILSIPSEICDDTPKYSDFLDLPLNLKGYFDYDEALACAKKMNKPVLLDFAGHTCKNCKKMYAEVWSDPRVLDMLRNEFIITALYTDDRTKLPEEEWVVSSLDGRVKNTLGKKFNDLQISKFGTNALPLYAIVDPKGNVLTSEEYYTYSPDIEKFLAFLENGIKNFDTSK
jgi:thiol:disulfide interchange protein DsbD